MRTWWGVTYGVIIGLLAAGVLYLATSPPRGEPIILSPPPTAIPLAVHVAGAVYHPGLYVLPRDCRVQDALDAAGGLLPEANTQTMNLAAYVQDGERIWVPYQASEPSGTQTRAETVPNQGDNQTNSVTSPTKQLININTASQAELENLPGIGPVTAQKIIAYRDQKGPFVRIEDIQDVSGIGPVTYERIKDLITLEELP